MRGATPIVGRGNEIAAIREFLGDVAAHPAGLVFAGDPGIGKTALWEAAVELSRGVGYRVLEHRSVQAESELAFSGLIDLIALYWRWLRIRSLRHDVRPSRWRCC